MTKRRDLADARCRDRRAVAAPRIEKLRDGVRVVVAGPPNSGKSSLVNALAGQERAIVTADRREPPATASKCRSRSTACPIILVDTAGLRDSDDTVEQIGVGLARREVAESRRAAVARRAGEAPERPRSSRREQVRSTGERCGRASRCRRSAGQGWPNSSRRSWTARATSFRRRSQLALNQREADQLERSARRAVPSVDAGDPVLVAEEVRTARVALDHILGPRRRRGLARRLVRALLPRQMSVPRGTAVFDVGRRSLKAPRCTTSSSLARGHAGCEAACAAARRGARVALVSFRRSRRRAACRAIRRSAASARAISSAKSTRSAGSWPAPPTVPQSTAGCSTPARAAPCAARGSRPTAGSIAAAVACTASTRSRRRDHRRARRPADRSTAGRCVGVDAGCRRTGLPAARWSSPPGPSSARSSIAARERWRRPRRRARPRPRWPASSASSVCRWHAQDRHAAAARRPNHRLGRVRSRSRATARQWTMSRSSRTPTRCRNSPARSPAPISATHDVIRAGLDRSPLFAGAIEGRGPRYCPSIEDKVHRFGDRDGHQIFLEPEGLDDRTVYPNGISTSLADGRPGRAGPHRSRGWSARRSSSPAMRSNIDYADPRRLDADARASGTSPAFIFAGQINGTTGYEEAAAQGLVAGANAAALCARHRRAQFRPRAKLYRRDDRRPDAAGRERALSDADRARRISPAPPRRQCGVAARADGARRGAASIRARHGG